MNYCKNCKLADCEKCGYFNSDDEKIKIFVIHAYEGQYIGTHGVECWSIEETTEKVANEFGVDMSNDVMDSYSTIIDELANIALSEGLDPDSKEYQYRLNELADENIMYDLYEVVKTDGKSIDELEKLMTDSPKDFIKEYCK